MGGRRKTSRQGRDRFTWQRFLGKCGLGWVSSPIVSLQKWVVTTKTLSSLTPGQNRRCYSGRAIRNKLERTQQLGLIDFPDVSREQGAA